MYLLHYIDAGHFDSVFLVPLALKGRRYVPTCLVVGNLPNEIRPLLILINLVQHYGTDTTATGTATPPVPIYWCTCASWHNVYLLGASLEHLARHIHITTLSLLIDEDYDTHPTTARPNANGDNTCTNNNQVFDTTGIQMIRDNNTTTAPRSRVPRVHRCSYVRPTYIVYPFWPWNELF